MFHLFVLVKSTIICLIWFDSIRIGKEHEERINISVHEKCEISFPSVFFMCGRRVLVYGWPTERIIMQGPDNSHIVSQLQSGKMFISRTCNYTTTRWPAIYYCTVFYRLPFWIRWLFWSVSCLHVVLCRDLCKVCITLLKCTEDALPHHS